MSKPLPDLTRVNGFTYGAEDLILDPKSPMTNARRLLSDRYTIDAAPLLHRQFGLFHGWTGTHYVPLESDYIVADIYHFLEYAKKPSQNMLVRYEPNRSRVNEIKGALEALCHLSDKVRSPVWLTEDTADLPAREIVSCQNGLLHLPSRELVPHTPHFFTLNSIDYSFDAAAPEPKEWLKFLHQLWGDDRESINTLQEFFGYCLVSDTSQQKAFMLVGPKRSGKGTIARILQAVIGQYNVVSPTLASLGTQFGLSPLIGKQLAIVSDARISQKTDTAIVAERLLAITGEDSVSAARKFLPNWDGKLDARFLIISNELPRINDASGALPSRFIVWVLTNSFYGKEDRGLTSRILAECPSILNWAIGGYARLCARGYFLQPSSADDAVRDMEDLSSPISAFARDRCIIAAGQRVECSLIFAEWQNWCDAQGRTQYGTLQQFGKDLRAVCPALKTTQPRENNPTRARFYEGIGLAAT